MSVLPRGIAAGAEEAASDVGWITTYAPLFDLGISGILLAALVWLIRRYVAQVGAGEWVPKRELDYMRENFQAQLADRDRQIERERQTSAEWRAAHETSEKTRELLNSQVRDFSDAFRVHSVFFDAFRTRIIDAPIPAVDLGSVDDPNA